MSEGAGLVHQSPNAVFLPSTFHEANPMDESLIIKLLLKPFLDLSGCDTDMHGPETPAGKHNVRTSPRKLRTTQESPPHTCCFTSPPHLEVWNAGLLTPPDRRHLRLREVTPVIARCTAVQLEQDRVSLFQFQPTGPPSNLVPESPMLRDKNPPAVFLAAYLITGSWL